LREIREMTQEMLTELRPYLPQFEGKTLKQTPTISIPADCVAVDVPLDPALAIGKRFGTLIEQKVD
jgi:alpha-galactosidase